MSVVARLAALGTRVNTQYGTDHFAQAVLKRMRHEHSLLFSIVLAKAAIVEQFAQLATAVALDLATVGLLLLLLLLLLSLLDHVALGDAFAQVSHGRSVEEVGQVDVLAAQWQLFVAALLFGLLLLLSGWRSAKR